MAGLWRTGVGIVGCEPDGSSFSHYSSPEADETSVILEGSAEVTVTSTGNKYRLEAGSIMSHPKGLHVTWDIKGPFLKKLWVLWDASKPGTPGDDLHVSTFNANPATWTPFEWEEPGRGKQTAGEMTTIRDTGSTGSLLVGLRRTGSGIAGCEPDGSATFAYTAPLGDETILLFEGVVHIVNEETGEEYDFSSGDVICLPQGLPIRWTSKAPFVTMFFVITNEHPPA
jgi:uncharacterized cupin superfamily protein